MNDSKLHFVWIGAALALCACDGGPSIGTDSGPTGTDAGPTGTDGSMGTDAGSMLGQPAEIGIDFGGCADFTPCGGDPTGTWDYTEICIEDPFGDLREACGSITFTDVAGTARGRVILDGVTATRDATVTVSATAILGPGCAVAGCEVIESALTMAVDTASCSANTSGGCDCAISQTVHISESSAYRVEGTQIITDGSTYDFCASGGSMQHRETGDNPEEPGILGLARR